MFRTKDYVQRFLSTLPVRGATDGVPNVGDTAHISIHAPREGSDGCFLGPPLHLVDISIHAPREGSDCIIILIHNRPKDFYPRSP